MTQPTTRNLRFLVSQNVFEIAIDAIAMHSKETHRFQSLRSVLQHASEVLEPFPLDANDFNTFARTTAIDGNIKIHLQMTSSWAPQYDKLKTRLADIWGKPIKDRTAVAYFLTLCVEHDLMGKTQRATR